MVTKDSPKMKRAYTKHTCSLDCDKPRCVKRQRDALVLENREQGSAIAELMGIITDLKAQLEERNTSRSWILRKLGL